MGNTKRLALVTGGARGVGRAIAERLARDNTSLIIADIHQERAQECADALIASGAEAVAMAVDVSDEASVRSLYTRINDQFGRLDILINNAGVLGLVDGKRSKVVDMPLTSWQETIGVNLTGVFLACRGALPLMMKNRWGRIVNISSRSARARTNVNNAHYAASKAGVLGFSRVLAFEAGEYGITVNSIAPSRMETEMTATQEGNYFQSGNSENVLGRLATIYDVAGAAAFLCSDEASYLTGIVIDVNGGAFMP